MARRSLKTKLTLSSLLTVFAALVIVSTVFLVLDFQYGKASLAEDLVVKADVIGANSRAAVAFDDAAYARETLRAFEIEPEVTAAAVLRPDGEVFASFVREGGLDAGDLELAMRSAQPSHFLDGRLLVLRPIVLDEETIGSVYLEASLSTLYNRTLTYLGILLLTVIFSVLVAWWIWTRLQRRISRPLENLVETVGAVTRNKDYSTRVQGSTDDELGTLVDGFNEMLGQIQHRDGRLREHQQFLERQVDRRTAELQRANADLQAEVAERRRAEGEMRKLSSAVTQGAEPVMITDTDGVIEFVNPAYENMTGFSKDELVGATPEILNSGEHDEAFFRGMLETIQSGEVFRDVVVNARKDGGRFYQEMTITPLKDPTGQITHYIATGQDITERMRAQEQLRQLAHHDTVTGLPNRALFMDRLDQAVPRARRHQTGFAVMFMDLDGFKTINDSLGHHVGDQLLKVVAGRLADTLRAEDTVARLGGDEFAIIVEDVADTQAVAPVARKLLESLAEPLELENKPLYVTGSIGISIFPRDGQDTRELLRRADSAMYGAKRSGKNTYRFYRRSEDRSSVDRLELEHHLRRAAEEEDFVLFYQPQARIDSGQLLGVEALLRFRHPEYGLLDPARFLDILEDTGLIIEVGSWALREACEQAVRWREQGLPTLRMSVNLSPLQFAQRDLAAFVKRTLDRTGMDPRVLHLEITERVLVESVEASISRLQELHALGVSISVDDFGVGYSSLNYLKRFPISKLKIDQSFVRDIAVDPDDAAIVRAVIALARSLRLDVVAEGVETEEQLAFLEAEGCDEIQGYLLSPPLSALAFMAWYADNCPLTHGYPHLELGGL